jgi:hypothetical protein
MRAIEAHHALNCGVRAVLLVGSLAAHNSSTQWLCQMAIAILAKKNNDTYLDVE